MTNRQLRELRDTVLGNGRGREVEVDPTGQIVLDPEGNQTTATRNEETDSPKPPRMSSHTWGM